MAQLPAPVFVALHLANELRGAGSQASDHGVDIVHCECDRADDRDVRRRVPVAAPARRGVKLVKPLQDGMAADELLGSIGS